MRASEIVRYLRTQRLPVSNEAALQVALERALIDVGVAAAREARLGPCERIDFLTDEGVGIEAKVKCPRRSIYRQLERYAKHDAVRSIVLVTATALGLPPSINNKPVFLVSLGRAAL